MGEGAEGTQNLRSSQPPHTPTGHAESPQNSPKSALPGPALTGEALEDVVEGAPGRDEGPEAGADGDDVDGDQAGLVPGVQERLGGGNGDTKSGVSNGKRRQRSQELKFLPRGFPFGISS